MKYMLKKYLKTIHEIANRGDAREESYYSTLENLLNVFTESINKKDVKITTIPKKTEAGNPDFRLWDGKQHIIGYIEAKAPTVENLDAIETSDQLKRYRSTFPNLILTNFLEFRLYRDGVMIEKVLIGRPFIIHDLKTIPPVEKGPDFLNLLDKFLSFSLPKVYDAKTLAIELAKRTRFLRDEVISLELQEKNEEKGFIHGFYKAFRSFLIAGLSEEDFADLYSQTITYGLFAARTRTENGFNRKLAYDYIPHTIGILRDVFKFISLEDVPLQMECIIDDISEVLSVTDVKKILRSYFHDGKDKDPIVHFYETFLAQYDPATREKRGVYYTPEPVVSYIVRSLHYILKEKFNRSDGFATESVTVLDPAAGTLTFPAEAAKLAVDEYINKYGEGGRESFIRDYVLKNFYAFELMMSPYAVGHLKMSFLLEELGYTLKKEDRAKLYLTNTLEMEDLVQTELPGMSSLSEESHLAGKVKKEQPILVILGNPPYSGHSANKGKWIDGLLKEGYKRVSGEDDEGYYRVDGQPLNERNPKWLQDDYVKFIRFAQWKIDQADEGILGFITNHSYLDNPTFRGMRRSLMKTFNEIYILDLHGNSLRKEKCPDGSKDQNVFDIRQGVAIALFIKNRGQSKDCKIYHSDLWGLRDNKYNWLLSNDLKTTEWKKITPKSEDYFFIPRDEKLLEMYQEFPKITEIFSVNSVGIVTSRDDFVIDVNKDALQRRISMFSDPKLPAALIAEPYKLKDKTNWKLNTSREKLMNDKDREKSFIKILYRPFDIRWIFYHDVLVERSRREVMKHMMKENLGLVTNRQTNLGFRHILCTDSIINDCTISTETKERSYLFPLYLYNDEDQKSLFSRQIGNYEKKDNISDYVIASLKKVFKNQLSPKTIFYYIYTVLYSNTYRSKYNEFLKSDFPRIPFTKNYDLFKKMANLGERLINLHLLQSDELDVPFVKSQGEGNNLVDKLKYDAKENRVYYNPAQYFEGVTKEIWEYQIGGYQVCNKWLKDRKGEMLNAGEIRHYCQVCNAIQKTIEIQKDIDDIYPEVEKDTIRF